MSEYMSIDLSPIVNAVNRVSNKVDNVDGRVSTLRSEITGVKGDLDYLKRSFYTMIVENRQHAALQRALTEIIRVRQELEQNYGNYKLVRDTMIGILSAADLALVKESTISNITEELMITTPKYWLAPVLIALSAWIADNKSLAERAIAEALKRDKEKTCLTFALICRRIGTKEADLASLEWLSIFFEQQKADNMKESVIAYIDAYTNNVFGEDRDNLCEEYISQWIIELKNNNPSFDREQIDYWKSYFLGYVQNTEVNYPYLVKCSNSDFTNINNQVSRVNALPKIAEFFAMILNTEVDRHALIQAIDNELIKLIKNYDDDEAPLREEEEYYTDIKNKNGDEKYANVRRDLRRQNRADRKVDLTSRLCNAITDNSSENISAKKTSIRFLKDYIKTAVNEFATEKQADFPEEITVKTCDDFKAISDGSNEEKMQSDFKNKVENDRLEKLSAVKTGGKTALLVFTLIFAVAAVIGFIIPRFVFVGVIGLILTVLFFYLTIKSNNRIKSERISINKKYDNYLVEGARDISGCIKEFNEVKSIVGNLDAAEKCNELLLIGE